MNIRTNKGISWGPFTLRIPFIHIKSRYFHFLYINKQYASVVGLVGTHPQFSRKSPMSMKDWSLLETKRGVFSHSAITLLAHAFSPLKLCSARQIIILANKIILRILCYIIHYSTLLSSVG